jgi:hypothetical protein
MKPKPVIKYVCAQCCPGNPTGSDDLVERCILWVTNGDCPTTCVFNGDEAEWEECTHGQREVHA